MARSFAFLVILFFTLNRISSQAQGSDCPEGKIEVEEGCVGQPTKFKYVTNGVITDYFWDFGDGNYSTDAEPIHIYKASSQYNVNENYKVRLRVNSCQELVENGNFEKYIANERYVCDNLNSNCYTSCNAPLNPNESFLNIFKFNTVHLYRYEWGKSCGPGDPYNTFRIATMGGVTTGTRRSDKIYNIGDHTYGNGTPLGNLKGEFLLIDGQSNLPPNSPDFSTRQLSWTQEVKVKKKTVYEFSCWVTNATGVSEYPKVDFGIEEDGLFKSMFSFYEQHGYKPTYNGEEREYSNTGIEVANMNWNSLKGKFYSGDWAGDEMRNLKLMIVSYSKESFGNDLGIDDISFKEDCGKNCDFKEISVRIIPCPQNPSDCNKCEPAFNPTPGEEYILSGWVKSEHNDNSKFSEIVPGGIKVDFRSNETDPPTNDESSVREMMPSGPIIDGWQKIEQRFKIPTYSKGLIIHLNNKGTNQEIVYFDDIRIFPVKANMKSFVYDPETKRLLATLDENNYGSFYEYDQEGKLIRVKKETEQGVQTIQESFNNIYKR